MEKRVAHLISAVFHPLLIPTYVFFFLFSMPVYFSLSLSRQTQWVLTGFVFFLTFIIPALTVMVMYKMRMVKSFTLTDREDRIFVLLFTAVTFYITFYFLKGIDISGVFVTIMFCSFIIGLAAFFITLFYKISLHLIGLGSLCGAMIMLTIFYGINGVPALLSCLVISGITGFARIKLSDHSPNQVYTGFLTGITLFVVIFILSV